MPAHDDAEDVALAPDPVRAVFRTALRDMLLLLAVLRDLDFYHRVVFAVVLLIGVLGSALLDYRAVRRGRVPYTNPSPN